MREGDSPPSRIKGPDGSNIKFNSWEEFTKWWSDPANTNMQSMNSIISQQKGVTPSDQGAVSTAAVNADNPPVVNSQEEYDALPSGTTYIVSNGTRATKP